MHVRCAGCHFGMGVFGVNACFNTYSCIYQILGKLSCLIFICIKNASLNEGEITLIVTNGFSEIFQIFLDDLYYTFHPLISFGDLDAISELMMMMMTICRVQSHPCCFSMLIVLSKKKKKKVTGAQL